MSLVRFRCRYCGRKLAAEKRGAGITVGCPGCGRNVRIPNRSRPMLRLVRRKRRELPSNPASTVRIEVSLKAFQRQRRIIAAGRVCLFLGVVFLFAAAWLVLVIRRRPPSAEVERPPPIVITATVPARVVAPVPKPPVVPAPTVVTAAAPVAVYAPVSAYRPPVPPAARRTPPAPPPGFTPGRLPFKLYSECDDGFMPYYPYGWMGNIHAIEINECWEDEPHSGKSCLKFTYDDVGKWAGIAWQDPPNNWGELKGGYDLTGAKALTFWARGETGLEKVEFKVGLLGPGKKVTDTARVTLGRIQLSGRWKQYRIPLEGRNLSRIVTGFLWVVEGGNMPITFYLDDIQFE